MGFTIETYQFYGLPQLSNIYVSIRGTYTIQKNSELPSYPNSNGFILPYYSISFKIYYSASKDSPIITQKDMSFNIQSLPSPANIYIAIYNEIKKNIDPDNILTITDE
jgi:hypothetical protein